MPSVCCTYIDLGSHVRDMDLQKTGYAAKEALGPVTDLPGMRWMCIWLDTEADTLINSRSATVRTRKPVT